MTIEDPGRTERRIVFLEYLRIFAFLSVVAGHQFYPYMARFSVDPQMPWLLRELMRGAMALSWTGGAGVLVFFLVSGYVITHVLGREDTGTFVVKRFFRIYPLYWTAVLLEALVLRLVDGTPFPPASVWIPRLLLIGDFFDTPYALKNVEWTLRIEVLFYALMALCRAWVMPRWTGWLPLLFVAASGVLALLDPFPDHFPWSTGFTTLFLPILFVGANVYLMERRLANTWVCLASSLAILGIYHLLAPSLDPSSTQSPYQLYALLLFVLAWACRRWLPDLRAVRWLAALTYGVYLFHHWAWRHLSALLEGIGAPLPWRDLQVFVVLLVLCAALHATVEKGGIALGRRLLARRAEPRRAAG